MTAPSASDRCSGALVGLAAGDRNGGPTEMAVRLAESLAQAGGFDPDDVFARYMDWYRHGAFDTGPVALAVFELCEDGTSRDDAVARIHERFGGMTAGTNPAHRVAPLAMSSAVADADLPTAAHAEAALTHGHPLAGDASAAVAMLVRRLIAGDGLSRAIEVAAQHRLPEIVAALDGSGTRSRGGFSPETLAAAMHFVRLGADFDDCLERSLTFAGPANYCPVLVGAVAGARFGGGAIGSDRLDHVADLPRVQKVAHRLADRFGHLPPDRVRPEIDGLTEGGSRA